jgi:hypothetical protein
LGQQQILLIVLAIIIIGVAIAISVQLFRSNAIEAKRDVLIEETTSLGAIAIQYYKKPSVELEVGVIRLIGLGNTTADGSNFQW